MIKSMTGFGKQVLDLGNAKVTIEIRTLNSKQLDVNCRISNSYKTYELDIRNLIAEQLQRGKVDCSITVEKNSAEAASVINTELANHYLSQIKELSKEIDSRDNKLKSSKEQVYRVRSIVEDNHKRLVNI